MPETLFTIAKRSAEDYLPPTQAGRKSLSVLGEYVQGCKGCDLYKYATQAVFGEGPKRARVLMVGEQPGDREDIQGKPFVGPAGGLLNSALEQAGIAREDVYLTNAVKHFKFELRGKRRIHQQPRASEINACRPWLEAELDAVRPELVVALGSTAARSLAQRPMKVLENRGRLLQVAGLPGMIVTVHPSSILRAIDEESREEQYRAFVKDLRVVAAMLEPRRASGSEHEAAHHRAA